MKPPSAVAETYRPTSIVEVQEAVAALPKVLPHGAKSKLPLLQSPGELNVTYVDMTALSGILEYDPSEYTFTAYAGTPVVEIAATLAQHGQYMPFDPPFVEAGATLGGTIAAGLSASGRYRYGGLRDFILGVHFVDGQGRLVRGGGKVVKNAAGFDLPKLMVGSMGRLGILVSASFKVFPAPQATASLCVQMPDLSAALDAMRRLMAGPFELECLDLAPQPNSSVLLNLRIGGPADVLVARLERLASVAGSGDMLLEDHQMWVDAREFAWVEKNHLLVKVATTAQTLPGLDRLLHSAGATRRYAVGGNLAWISWPDSVDSCQQLLLQQGISGLVVRGDSERALIGASLQRTFLDRVRHALDPGHKFVEFE